MNIEKYKVGIPKTLPISLKIKTKGIFKINIKIIDRITNFCSCLFFILFIKVIKKTASK